MELHSPTVPSESSVMEEATRLAAAWLGLGLGRVRVRVRSSVMEEAIRLAAACKGLVRGCTGGVRGG